LAFVFSSVSISSKLSSISPCASDNSWSKVSSSLPEQVSVLNHFFHETFSLVFQVWTFLLDGDIQKLLLATRLASLNN
jgi:hypothetical protein